MITEGATDQAIAAALRVGRMSVARHRANHVLAPAQALAAAAGKDREAVRRRTEVMAAAESGDPSAFAALSAIVNDLRTVHARLERAATAAETDNQRMTLSTLSAQQLRAMKVRAKLGGVGGYAPACQNGDGAATQVSIQMVFSGGHSETITMAAGVEPAPVIDVESDELDAPEIDTRSRALRALARAFGAT